MNTSITNKSKPYKVVLVGDGGTGKSSYVCRLNRDKFESQYVATLGVEKYSIAVDTSDGMFLIEVWDTAGQEKRGPMRDNYYIGADAAIMFFDVTSRITYKNIPAWYHDIVRVSKDIPTVLCANKIDVEERKVKRKSITFQNKHNIGFFEISVKDGTLLMDPIEYILSKLLDKPELKIKNSFEVTHTEEDVFEDLADSLDKSKINYSDTSSSCGSDKEFHDAAEFLENLFINDDTDVKDAST